MSCVKDAAIIALIERLSNEINFAQEYSLDRTIYLLRIALLDLRMMAFSISDDELRCLTDRLEDISMEANKLNFPQ